MLESRMMADTGCMPKVSGSSSDTPLGAPRPGKTPTRMPSSIRKIWLPDSAMLKPCIRALRFSNAFPSETEEIAERAARQRDLERQLEGQIERDRGADRGD